MKKYTVIALLTIGFTLPSQAKEATPFKVWVKAFNKHLVADKHFRAKKVAPLDKGAELLVTKQEGMWYQVKDLKAKKKGYIAKIYTTKRPPKMASDHSQKDLAKKIGSLDKKEGLRKRKFAVMGVRGFTDNGRQTYIEPDLKGISKMESQLSQEVNIDDFAAQLGQQK